MTTTQSLTPSIEDVMNILTELIKSNGSLDAFEIVYDTYNNTTPYNLFTISIDHGCTLLHACVAAGNKPVAQFLLENGADPNIRTEFGNTPLHGAARYNELEMAQLLLQYGASVNAENTYTVPKTPLNFALYNNNLDLMNFLLDHGAKANYDAMYYCMQHYKTDAMKRLIECCKQEDTERALFTALLFDNKYLHSTLQETRNKIKFVDLVAGCLESKFNNNAYERLLYKFAESTGSDGNTILRHILDKLDDYGQLDQQVLNKALRISTDIDNNGRYYIKILIMYGADANMRDEHGESLVCYIVRSVLLNNLDRRYYGKNILKELVKCGAKVSDRDKINGFPLLHCVMHVAIDRYTFYCIKSFLKCLIRAGADANIRDENGHTILYYLLNFNDDEHEYNNDKEKCIDYLKLEGVDAV